MICKKCNQIIDDNSIFCSYCGNPIQSDESNENDTHICPECHTNNDGDHIFCEQCGAKLVMQQNCMTDDQTGLPDSMTPTPNTPSPKVPLYSILGLGIFMGAVLLFLVLWFLGIIDW